MDEFFDHTGTASAAVTAEAGYRVIGCPAPYAYLDLAWDYNINEPGFHWAGTADLAICYAYEPHGDDLSEENINCIFGIQALLWTELVTTPEKLEYMLFPRLFATAETAWSEKGAKDWEDFQRRVDYHLTLLDQRGVNHRVMSKATA